MSTEKDNDAQTWSQVTSDSLEKIHHLHLYYVRIHDVKYKLKVQAEFANKIMFTFNEGKPIYNHENVSPVIYTLDLTLIQKNNKELYVEHEGRLKPINEYRLRCSYIFAGVKTFKHEEKCDTGHPLLTYIGNEHLFHFNIRFHSSLTQRLPGLDAGPYTDLCLFTCFLLDAENYYPFNALVDQFQAALSADDYSFNKNDFQNFFENCVRYLLNIPVNSQNDQKSIRLIIILRMIGLLSPIKKESFDRDCTAASVFTKYIMTNVRATFTDILAKVDSTEQLLFKSGLAILTALDSLYQQKDDLNDNKIAFLHQIPDEKERQDIANEILIQLSQLDQSISDNSNWPDLFTIVDPDQINITHLNLAASFEGVIVSITKISTVLKNYHQFRDDIDTWLHNRLLHNFLKIDLPSLLYLLQFLRQKLSDDQTTFNQILSAARLAILTNNALKMKIKLFFDQFEINMKNIEDISFIISSINEFTIFEHINKYEYLGKSLKNGYSEDYYIKWCQRFLVNNQIRNNDEQDEHKHLLECWLNCLKKTSMVLIKVLKAIDKLLDSFDKSNGDDWFYLYFMDHIIDLCFEQDSVFHVIDDGLRSVQNETFRSKFLKIFDQKYLNQRLKDSFKNMNNHENLLYKLIDLYKRENNRSKLVWDLIELICNQIEITYSDIIDETFNEPKKSTFTYIVLFEESLANLSVRKIIIKQLNDIWDEWQNDGFFFSEIQNWNRLKHEQKQTALQIWNFIEKYNRKSISFDKLINEENRKLKNLIQIKENVQFCITNYCHNASDTNDYSIHIQHLQKQLDEEKISSIEISKDIKKLQPYVECLAPISKSQFWQKFLKQYESNSICAFTKENSLDVRYSNTEQLLTCLKILEKTKNILDLFIQSINDLWNDKTQPFLPQLEHIFPEQQRSDYEFNIIKSLLDQNVALYIKILLDYWNNRDNINHICKGYIYLCQRYNLINPDKLVIIENILSINESTSGESFLKISHDYETNFAKIYAEPILNFTSQWSSSNQVIEFLYSLQVADVDNLLEVVNDWDETFINTAVILDFVLLKSFLDQFDARLKDQNRIEFHDIISCFEQLHNKKEFHSIINVFKQCSQSLSTIQHIHTASTNREQSKRKHILDIMQGADIGFCLPQSKHNVFYENECEFDVCVTDKKNSKATYFTDLSELRDRARFIEYSNTSSNHIQTYTDNDIQQLRLFISFIETIESILKTLTALNRGAYPFLRQYLWPQKKFLCHEGKYTELEEFNLSLNKQFNDWDRQLCTMYEKCLDLTYFTYQQIWIVEKSLYERSITNGNDFGYHLLKFIGIDPQSVRLDLLPPLDEGCYNRLKNMVQILNTQRIQRNVFIQEDNINIKQIFFIQTSYQGILRAILSLFNRYKMPIHANKLFYCTKTTNWIEIRAFIYRCFYSQTLHQLIQPELLPLIIQDQCSQLLNQLIEQSPKHLFRLGIITTASLNHLPVVNSLKIENLIKIIYDQDLLNEADLKNCIQKLVNNKCKLIQSRIAGLGKSTHIQNEILRLGKNHIKFPIVGDVNIDTLMERLRDIRIQSAPSTVVIHINLGPVENIQQVNEFLYCLILFRCFRLGQMPVYVSSDILIFIELDSSSYLSSLINEIIIFQYLQKEDIDHMNWNELDVNNSSKVQFIANYLQAIEDGTITKTNIYEEQITQIDAQMCIRLLHKYFLPQKNPNFISWTQLSIFIEVYYKLFSSFSKCGFFIADPQFTSTLRFDVLKSLLNSSNQFTSLSVETVRQNQRSIYGNDTFIPFSEAIVRWDKTQPFTIIFTPTYDPLFIYKTLTAVPTSVTDAFLYYYQVIYKTRTGTNTFFGSVASIFKSKPIINTSGQIESSIKEPKQLMAEYFIDPNKMTHEQFFLRLLSLSTRYLLPISICEKCFKQYEYCAQECQNCSTNVTLIKPLSNNGQAIEDFQKKIAKRLYSEYVLTADNYIKMLLIYLRVQSNLPVLIMGETGCGKTALIQTLCQKILDDEMGIFRIHAGITNENIVETMQSFIKQATKNPNKRLWVFFDEFNTTPSIGLLKEVICERTLLGKALPKNIVLLGTCNPQRRKKNKDTSSIDNNDLKNYYSKNQYQINGIYSALHYSVVAIPETMLEYVWDYGHLDDDTENNYIKTILNACKDLKSEYNHSWFNCTVNMVSQSQKFFRKSEDVSSVSLRDVARFCRFYNWFYNTAIPSIHNTVEITPDVKCKHASLLALFLCYYFRIDSANDRKTYITILEKSIKTYEERTSRNFLKKFDSLEQLLEWEKMALVNRMELPSGTATNRALTDNIFVLFTCILNRIPVILSGKPGSSKTSAVQIVMSNLKGATSNDAFFKTLPKLLAISYQGSHNCTSESIIKVFAQADKSVQTTDGTKLLPVIVFDEIGLAELSPHNPLKVLHNELEIETCRYGFVGLSNWRLDASKMNRAVYLSCPEPDLGDLKLTAKSLSQAMISEHVQTIPLDDSIIESLAATYMKLCQSIKEHYFGLRDYYSLVKGIVHDMITKNDNQEQDLYKIIHDHISFNFDGTIDGSKFLWSKFCQHIQQEHRINQYAPPTFDQLLDHSLSSRIGRFLMLIGDNENTFDYVQQYIINKYPSIQTRTLIGSSFHGDFLSNRTYTEQYNSRILMDIILYAEKDLTLFLRGLGHLYDNLYDLFNQNFAVSAKKKYCRIALGSIYHPRCVIHENFYCVVFVKSQDLEKYDLPFLNRFEKHLIDINSLIQERHQTILSILNQWIEQILSIKQQKTFFLSKYLSMFFNNDYILNLVTDIINENPMADDENVIKYCQAQIIRTMSFDFPLLLSVDNQHDCHLLIEQYYQIHTNLSFSSYMNQILKEQQIPKFLIYTYTQIYHVIDYTDITNHEQLIEEIKLSHFKTELELIGKIKLHYQTRSCRLLCIHIDYYQDHQHIPMLKHILINEPVLDESYGICLIFHLQRNKINQTNNDTFFNGWSSIVIDDLQKHQILPQHILRNPSYEILIDHLNFLSLESIFDDLINRCIIKFRYIVTNKMLEPKINERRDQIIQQLCSSFDRDTIQHQSLRSIIKDKLSHMIKNVVFDTNNQSQLKDWRQDLLTNEIITGSSHSFNDAMIKTIATFLDQYLSQLLAYVEKHSMIDSYAFILNSNKQIQKKLHEIWLDCLNTIMKKVDISIPNQNYIEIPLVFDLHLPCATLEHEIIRQIGQTIAQERIDDDTNWLDIAYKQLISKSIYGQFVNEILANIDLFNHYFYDQLTLVRDRANIYQLSTSFIQRLLTIKIYGTVKDQLGHLLIDYDELIEIMKLFEISLPFIGDEEMIFQLLDQQLIIDNGKQNRNKTIYRLIMKESNFYLIPPACSESNEKPFKCSGNPFIELSLMNLVELLTAPMCIERINNMEQLITVYARVVENMITLTHYGHYEINNLEKIHSFLRLASCISNLFPNDKALIIFKEIYNYSGSGAMCNTLEKLHNFIVHLNKIVHEEKVNMNNELINKTLMKLESELLRNWFLGNVEQSGDVLKYIHDHSSNLWKYSAKIFTLINTSLDLSSIIMKNDGDIPENDDYENINQYLDQLTDPTRKIEVLLITRIYMGLIFDENYQFLIDENNKHALNKMLTTKFDSFKENFNRINNTQNNQKLELIGSIAWIKYYLLYCIYALKNDIKTDIMETIDRFLVKNTSTYCSTIQLYIIKQLCYIDNSTFYHFSRKYKNRNVLWIKSLINQSSVNVRDNLILPTPLFECHDDFVDINIRLTSHITDEQFRTIIQECRTKQTTAYAVFIWFIHYYTRFYMNDVLPDDQIVKLIANHSQALAECFEPIGYKFIHSLCMNFDEKSYFRLNPSVSEEDFHQRLIVLNIIALLISFKSLSRTTLLSSILYDKKLQIPEKYIEHFKKLNPLSGMNVANDPALIQMSIIRNKIIKNNVQSMSQIFRCSSNCVWLFYIINSAISSEHKHCPLCKRAINISQKEDSIIINEPHIQMSTNETLQFINTYIEEHKRQDCLDMTEKPDHLKQSVTYHFINLLTYSVFLFLNESNFMPMSIKSIGDYYRESIKTSYNLLRKDLFNVDQCYIWLYKLFNHMINKDFVIDGDLTEPNQVIKLEQCIEQKLILPHISSVINEMRDYKLVYANCTYGDNVQNLYSNFVEELIEDDEKYPLLKFFNVTNIHSINIIDDFYTKLQLRVDHENLYPLTTFIFKHLSNYDHIPYLYSIIKFMNYLMQKFDHRIKRDDAKEKTIADCLKNDSTMETIYQQFLDVWYRINLTDVYFNGKQYQFQRLKSSDDFADKTNLAAFLLNKSNDNEYMIPIACLQTVANFQNEIIHHFHSQIVLGKDCERMIPIQSIQQKHLFNLNTNKLKKILIDKCLMTNCAYGRSKETFYDYDEIEWILRNEISCLPLIDIKNIKYFNYQFELYDENLSLLMNIRQHFQQDLFEDFKRKEIQREICNLNNVSILNLYGLIEYILIYLHNVNNKHILENLTIQQFIKEYIHSNISMDKNLIEKNVFALIHLKYIIDFYELIEECIFDQILSNNIRNELSEKAFSIEERTLIIEQFNQMIFNNENLADIFKKDLICWIGMFKRLLVRLLLPRIHIDFESSLNKYIKRNDMWRGNITEENIRTIDITNTICLKHTFIILKGLESKENEKNQNVIKDNNKRPKKQDIAETATPVKPKSTSMTFKPKDTKDKRLLR